MSKGRKNRKRKVTSSNSLTNDSKPNEKKQRSSNKTGNDDDNSDKIMREHEEQHDDLTELDCIPTRCVLKEQIETGMRARCFVLVEGPIGCGKTSIVREIALKMKTPLSVFQMGDQIDSKTLYGAFHCAEIPGEFIWKPSKFTKVIRKRGVILLEDLDCASVDLISALVDICEKRLVKVNAGEVVRMHPEAYIVASMRISPTGSTTKSAAVDAGAVMCSIPLRVRLPAFSDEEMRRIIYVKYGRVAPFTRKLIAIFNDLLKENTLRKQNSKRMLTSTDLFRACERMQHLTDLTDNVAVMGELIDVWAMHCVSIEDVKSLAAVISDRLSVNRDQLEYYLNLRLPQITLEQERFICGRIQLRISAQKMHTGRRRLMPQMGITRDVCQLMERLAVCITRAEPVLLVGETGVGKTSVVQAIAAHTNVNLRVVNLSQHSDSSDLIGGYKPVSLNAMLKPLKNVYDETFAQCFNIERNANFLSKSEECLSAGRFADFATLMCEIARRALALPAKSVWHPKWAEILVRAERFRQAVLKSALPFAYVRGVVAQAAECGDWLLVDEINLAPSECLDAIVHVMDDSAKSRHPNFRLFACMNPATDTGKRNLPDGIRTRFTEIFVRETTELDQLSIIGRAYLPALDAHKMNNILELYRALCEGMPGKYSLRTLCRALTLASTDLFGGEQRCLVESISLSFISDLDSENRIKVEKMIAKCIGKVSASSGQIPKPVVPSPNGRDFVRVEGYWLETGTTEPKDDPQYVCTKSVRRHLADLARIVCSGRYPILLEGETSAGKTAMVTHLARITGNVVVRINNHEHTDLQEYIGSYAPDATGKLVFVEGALLKAVRAGSWVILDELNLAPTDVIEALNRLLDDNRELFVSELNNTVKAHPSFRLFATQNPVSTYAGRKRLSRALVNRFVVLKFEHLPFDELAQMVCARCAVAPSSANKMVSVLCELRAQRSLMGVFSARDGLMTLRDVFRWAKRLANSDETADWQQSLADQGFFLLAARCRNSVDEQLVKETLEKILKRRIDVDKLFAMDSLYMPEWLKGDCMANQNVVLTSAMRRMLVLCAQAWHNDEPVLMVGETGGGKTTVADLITKGELLSVNCHERTETSDFLGSLRPVGDGTFRWMDGVVVEAMKRGRPLLIDEISLASDSVLERLNPLLEPSRTLLLTDAGTVAEEVIAEKGFNIIATMNPGGDYGKKELSKALRNRFTEFWCPADFSADDMKRIVLRRMSPWRRLTEGGDSEEGQQTKEMVARCIVKFISCFSSNYSHIFRCGISIRDVVSITELFVASMQRTSSISRAIYHSLSATIFDAIGAIASRVTYDRDSLIGECVKELNSILREEFGDSINEVEDSVSIGIDLTSSDGMIVSDFLVPFGSLRPSMPNGFTFEAPTCKRNIYRLARALSIDKPILIEGAPGCGKSSTVVALAAATGHPLTRLNLSDQTDLSDLFGSDIPVVLPDGSASFAWSDGPVLSAIKQGHWILLDEMNLASQSVLEGLNACLDYRRRLFIAELNRSFEIGTGSGRSRFFACQNPRGQGGNRRALPKSFVNRFTTIYAEDLTADDERIIIAKCFAGQLSDEDIRRMIGVKEAILQKMATDAEFAIRGAPFEFNLRDMLRWAELGVKSHDLAYAFDLLYVKRLRTSLDRMKMRAIFADQFGYECIEPISSISLSKTCVRIGKVQLPRRDDVTSSVLPSHKYLLSSQMQLLEQVAVCVQMNWLTLLTGKSNVGKASTVNMLAELTGNRLSTMRLTSETDALELLGSFEQMIDYVNMEEIKAECMEFLVDRKELRDAVANCDDALALRLAIQSAAYLVEEETAGKLNEYAAKLGRCTMRFSWINSCFMEAFANGHWILIENVNCCSAAVLDRLNTCLESNGELLLSERGDCEEPIKAHPNFRVFFTMDEANGTISRAMRNRSIELFVLPEQNAWNRRILDVISVVAPEDCSDTKLMCALRGLFRDGDNQKLMMSEELIRLKILLSGMPLDQVVKIMNLNEVSKSDVVDEDDTMVAMESEELNDEMVAPRYPRVDADIVGKLDEWKCAVWRVASSDESDHLMGAVWCLLSSTKRRLKADLIQSNFPESYGLLSGLIDTMRSHEWGDGYLPFDDRFEGPVVLGAAERNDKDYSFENKIILQAFVLWIAVKLKQLTAEEGSAAYLSEAFVRKQIRPDQLKSECVRYIYGFVEELRQIFPSQYTNLPCSFDLLIEAALDVLLFVYTASRKHDERVDGAAVHVAWQRINSTFTALPFASIKLKRSIDQLSETWSVANEVDVDKFLRFYKRYRIVTPFSDHENLVEASNGMKRIGMDLSNDHEVQTMDTVVADSEKVPEETSAFASALRMIMDIFGCFAILKRDDTRQVISEISERATHQPVHLRSVGMFKWIDELWSRIAYWLTFMCDDFAVYEFPSVYKNIDLITLPIGVELMRSVWRSLEFNRSLCAVSLKQFDEFAKNRERFCYLLWKLTPHLEHLNEAFRKRLVDISCNLKLLLSSEEEISNELGLDSDGMSSLSATMEQLQQLGLSLMQRSLPAENMVDPVLSDKYNHRYLENKLSLVDEQLEIVQRYQCIVSGQDSLRLFETSKHPLIASLIAFHRNVSEQIETYKGSKQQQAFRPSYGDFGEVSAEMRSFLRMTSDWFSNVGVEFNEWQNRSTEQLKLKKAQLESFIVSASTFCNRIINNYLAYGDITQPFLFGVRALLITLAYVRSQIDGVLNARQLMFGLSMPSTSKFEIDEFGCVRNDEMMNWCLMEKSIMPKRLQICLVEAFLRQRSGERRMDLCIKWIEKEWQKWYERNSDKKEKSFVYRKSKSGGGFDGSEKVLDDDELEIRKMFPDFSTAFDGDCAESMEKGDDEDESNKRNDTMADEELSRLLHGLLDRHGVEHQLESRSMKMMFDEMYLPMMWLLDTTCGAMAVESDIDRSMIVSHLWNLRHLDGNESNGKRQCVIDVYKENSPSELMRCVEALSNLNKRLRWLREKWPEMTVLNDILQVAERILNSPATMPQMQFAALLERLLGEAEHWEKVADREHSISEELNRLREILVDWRKMEVLCWNELLHRVRRVCSDGAFLIAWPLFESLKDEQRLSNEILAICIEWIQKGTLIDFDARLDSVRLLANCAVVTRRSDRNVLKRRLLSVVAYFEQYTKIIESKFEALKAPMEAQLRDFVKIVKYNDLNLWSVKLSAQKAHQQLFRIVKQFKICGNEPVLALIDTLLPIPSSITINEQKNLAMVMYEMQSSHCEEILRVKRAKQITETIVEKMNSHEFCADELREIVELTVDCDQLIRKEILYEGDDAEKEKQQGRAMDERQKAISLLLKKSNDVGVRYRRGITIDSEALTGDAVTNMADTDCTLTELVRQCAASRSIALKSLHKPNDQLSASTILRMKGITEYTLQQLLKWNKSISVKNGDLKKIQCALGMLGKYADDINSGNVENNAMGCVNHQQWYRSLCSCSLEILPKLSLLSEQISAKLNCAPEEECEESSKIYQMSGLQDTALSAISKQNAQFVNVQKLAENIHKSVDRLRKLVGDELMKVDKCERIVIWRRQNILELNNVIHREAESLSGDFVELSWWMQEESERGIGLSEQLIKTAHISILDCDERVFERNRDDGNEAIESAILFAIQLVYKRLVDDGEEKAAKKTNESERLMDRMSRLFGVMMAVDLSKSASAVWDFCALASEGNRLPEEELRKTISFCASLLNVFGALTVTLERFSEQLSLFCLHFESVVVQLLQKGYVNAIPKPEQNGDAKGDGRMVESDEPAGMGDGQGDRNVADEMDNMGQIEGLKGENEQMGEKCDQREKEDETDKPIDVDDDFAADLENIDREEKEDDEEDEDREGDDDEPELDDAMGEVDESDENKLDPELWDKEDDKDEKQTNKDLDQNNEGVNEKSDQLTAKDDERQNNPELKELESEEHDEGDTDQDRDLENVDERNQSDEMNPDEQECKDAEPKDVDEEQADSAKNDEDQEHNEDEECLADIMDGKKLDDDVNGTGEDNENELEEECNKDIQEESAEQQEDEEVSNDQNLATTNQANEENDEANADESAKTHGGGGMQQADDEDATKDDDVKNQATNETNESEQNESESDDTDAQNKQNSSKSKSEQQQTPSEKTDNEQQDKSDETKVTGEKDDEKERKNEAMKKLATELERMETDAVQEGLDDDDKEREEVAEENREENNFTTQNLNETLDSKERLVIDKASIQEAKDSKDKLEQLKNRRKEKNKESDDLIREVPDDEEEQGESMENEGEKNEQSSSKLSPSNYAPFIHTSTNLYQLADIATMAPDIAALSVRDDEEVAESDRMAEERWSRICESLSVLSAELAENLRMIIEPTIASRLEGDYRSGKRLNMRRLIAYIASDYRKDRIWLRRTKKAQRNYQILLAVDDSASMDDNNMNLMACQSVCVIGSALRQLEVGQLAICKFGSKVKLLSDFCAHADSTLGGQLIRELTFKQDKTDLVNLLNVSRTMLEEARNRSDRSHQMMIIVSDGRGVLADGSERIIKALNALHQEDVTVLFVAVDNAHKSIVDTKVAEFRSDGQVELVPYMNKFPFPFYTIVRHISTLPATLADAIRQWFEMTVRSS